MASSTVTLLWTARMDGSLSEMASNRSNTTAQFVTLLTGFGRHRRKDAAQGKASLPCVHPCPTERREPYRLETTGGRPRTWYCCPPQVVMLDVDNKDGSVTRDDAERWHSTLQEKGVEHAVWETASSTPDRPRYRVAVPLAPGSAREGDRAYSLACAALADAAGVDRSLVDPAGSRLSQVMALPAERNLDGREPETWYGEGERFAPVLCDVVVDSAPDRPSRSLDQMPDDERAFNERYGPDGEGLEGLAARYGEQMGCVYTREGNHWLWHGADGSEASQPGVFASEVPGAYVDMYGSSPLCGRVAFAMDFLVFQSALKEYGVDSLDDDVYKAARRRYADPARRNERLSQVADVLDVDTAPSDTAPSDTTTGAPTPGAPEGRRPSLLEVVAAVAPRKKERDGSETILVNRVTQSGYAPRLAPHFRALDDVRMSFNGIAVRTDGSIHKALVGDEKDALLGRMLKELCPDSPVLTPGVDFPANPSRAFLTDVLASHLQRPEARLQDPRTALLDHCEKVWESESRPEPRDLFPRAPGIVPTGASHDGGGRSRYDIEYDWAVFNRLWLLAAHRVLRPGSDVGSVIPFLTGGQNAGKNELADALAGKYVTSFAESVPSAMITDDSILGYTASPSAAETLMHAATRSVVLMDEVQGLGDGDATSRRLKAFATTTEFSVTPKYMGAKRVPRSFLLLGAANNACRGLVPADEGYRRYMVVPMVSADEADGSMIARKAYRDLSRLVSPSSTEREYLSTMLLGWATHQVRQAVADGTEHDLIDADFTVGGRWWERVVENLLPVFGSRDVLADLLRDDPVDGTHLLVRDVLAGRVTSKRREALEFWVRVALGGHVDRSGEVAVVDPDAFARWRSRLFDTCALKMFQEGGTV